MAPTSNDKTQLRRSLRLYRAAAPFVSALLVPGFLRRLIKRGGYRAHFWQRFGLFEKEELCALRQHRWTWIRSISVGETLVALKLAHSLRLKDPCARIALSVTTSTGYAVAAKHISDWLFVFYNPVDSQSAVLSVINALKPTGLILIEGEIWPNLMNACFERDVPVMLANARLSKRSAKRFAKFKKWTSPFFNLLQWIGIPDEEDRARWESIGVPSHKLIRTGSIKFDEPSPTGAREQIFANLLHDSGVDPRDPIIVAGSTHDGEEEILVRSLQIWRQENPSLRLLIAPRHIERVPAILNALKTSNAKVLLRSLLPANLAWDVLLIDTTGELKDWYSLATVAFVGKSLTAIGGQNPVEAALAGKPVVFGPHMENFESVVRLLLSHAGASQAHTPEDLIRIVEDLLSDPDKRKTMGENGRRALGLHQGSTEVTAELVLRTVGQRTC